MMLTPEQKKELEDLARKPDHEIDTSDIPELTPEELEKMAKAERGRFYRGLKKGKSDER